MISSKEAEKDTPLGNLGMFIKGAVSDLTKEVLLGAEWLDNSDFATPTSSSGKSPTPLENLDPSRTPNPHKHFSKFTLFNGVPPDLRLESLLADVEVEHVQRFALS